MRPHSHCTRQAEARRTFYQISYINTRCWPYSLEAESLPSVHKPLGFIPSTERKKKSHQIGWVGNLSSNGVWAIAGDKDLTTWAMPLKLMDMDKCFIDSGVRLEPWLLFQLYKVHCWEWGYLRVCMWRPEFDVMCLPQLLLILRFCFCFFFIFCVVPLLFVFETVSPIEPGAHTVI